MVFETIPTTMSFSWHQRIRSSAARRGHALGPVQGEGELRCLEAQRRAQRFGQPLADEIAPQGGGVDLLVSGDGVGGGVAGTFAGAVPVPSGLDGTFRSGLVDRAAD